MRSLTLKLILAFLIVSLAQAGLMAYFSREAAEREFEQFIQEQARTHFIETVVAHYRAAGSWAGAAQSIGEAAAPPRRLPPGAAPDQPPPGAEEAGPPAKPFALVDQNGIVVVPAEQYRTGDRVATRRLAAGTPVVVDAEVVGTALRTEASRQLSARERRYLEHTSRAILYATGIGLTLALVLGVALAQRTTRPLRRLTEAARALARGELGTTVSAGSRDEVGTLASAFNQMSADLKEAADLRRRMTADIAHDLRTPLTVLIGYLEALRTGDLPPSPERFGVMHDEAQHLGRLVEDLRTLSLADAGELSLHPQAVAPRVLLERIQRRFTPQTQGKDIELNVTADPSLPYLHVDPDRMDQVLGNLVQNALRHTAAGGRITLSAQGHGAQIALQVADTGSGISADALPHVFDRFYRADESRQRKQGESGLGLAIVQSIIEAHGGTIAVESELGRGTTFTMLLPSADAETSAEQPSAEQLSTDQHSANR